MEQLCRAHGGVKAVAEMAGLGWEGLDQILKKTPLPRKKDGTASYRALGDLAAQAIEDALNLGRGWFDWPLEAVDFVRYWALAPQDRAYAQAQMMVAIEEKSPKKETNLTRARQAVESLTDEERLALLTAIMQEPAADTKVGKHYRPAPLDLMKKALEETRVGKSRVKKSA